MPQAHLMFLLIGPVLTYFPIRIMAKKDEVSVSKSVLITFLLSFVGLNGAFLMYYVENGVFGKASMYGALFFVPIVFLIISRLLRLPYGVVMDYCAVGQGLILAIMKANCLIGGCCFGRIIYHSNVRTVRFPSRETEIISAIIIFALLLNLFLKGKGRGNLYAWLFVLYGSVRFILNLFRDTGTDGKIDFSIGNIWSLLSVIIGLTWLLIVYYLKINKQYKEFTKHQ